MVTEFDTDEDEFLFDEIKGSSSKKKKMALLNKNKLDFGELDDLFLDDSMVFSDRKNYVVGSADIPDD